MKEPILRIFIVGANGFIGSYITAKLLKEGHEVVCAVRDVEAVKLKFPSAGIVYFDLNKDIPSGIVQELKTIDVVVNVAGLLQSSGKNKIDNVHFNGPKKLFDTCVEVGIKKIIHISALGIESENTTDYALSKKLADNYLKTLNNIDWVILQPSLVYASGCYGGTSLFRALSTLPFFIPLVGDGSQKFQPIHMDDLTAIVSFCVNKDDKIQEVIKLVGPEVVSMKEILTNFRRWLGLKSASHIKIPLSLIRIGAKIGDLFGSNILNSTLYKMMMHPNIADKENMINITGIIPRSFEKGLQLDPLTAQSLWHAKLYLLKPILKVFLSLFWICSGLIANATTFESTSASIILYSSCFIDIALGMLLLFSNKISKICSMQIAVIAIYTLSLITSQANLWIDLLGALLNNIAIILLTLVLMAIEKDK